LNFFKQPENCDQYFESFSCFFLQFQTFLLVTFCVQSTNVGRIGKEELDGESKDGYNAVHGLVLPSDGAAAVRRVVPVAGGGRVKAGPVFLHDDARNDIFEGFLQFC